MRYIVIDRLEDKLISRHHTMEAAQRKAHQDTTNRWAVKDTLCSFCGKKHGVYGGYVYNHACCEEAI